MRYHAVHTITDNALRKPLPCAQCGEQLIAARWSEHLTERCIRHVWECDVCGYQFETAVYVGADTAAERRREAA
jgi:ribosomal protein L37AE/L43A